MLPILQAEEIKHATTEYLKATFNFQDKNLQMALNDFLFDKRKGMFKGPYMQLRLPFEKTDENDKIEDFIKIKPSFAPYRHQFQAFKRLSTRGKNKPEPVILTTGTGSGKTESFLFPLLDYCHQHRNTPGIKAIILYPMNALATDQARRLAEEIHNFKDAEGNHILRDKIRAGLFIGEGRDKKQARSNRMEADCIIEDRQTLLQSPPDILLTNFKMLDFALMRAEFNQLWQYNYKHTQLLKFLVLDELHTYDGAKGSDVANLIRRLKLKLNLPQNQIVPVGTSATMAGGEDGKNELVKFFSEVFGVPVNKQAVIEEQRILPEEFFSDEWNDIDIDLNKIQDCNFLDTDDYDSYLNRQLQFWGYDGLDPVQLGIELKKNSYLFQLLTISNSQIKEVQELTENWQEKLNKQMSISLEQTQMMFASLLALIAYAKEKSGPKKFPFLYLQITYWLRSLNRVLRKVQATPLFQWESDLNPADSKLALPPYYCRECGATGWIGLKKEHSETLEQDLSKIRQLFIANKQNKNIYFISSMENKQYGQVFADDYQHTGDPIDGYIDPYKLTISSNRSNDEAFKVLGVRVQNSDSIVKLCPHCNSLDTLALIGTGIPTIESVATAQILSTSMDNTTNHNRKLLAFTNGVQDAAHQAGFIENRNYRFGVRHAIQTAINQNQEPMLLSDFYTQFQSYWKQNTDANAENPEEAYFYKFLPPDCESSLDIKEYTDAGGKFQSIFQTEFQNRISWELWSEFSYNAAIGRTLERSAASAVSYNFSFVDDVYEQMKYWFDQNQLSKRIAKQDFQKFINGFLHRLRQRGGVDHPYLRKYRTDKTNYYLLTQNTNKAHFLMKNFGKHTRLPKFMTFEKGQHTAAFDVIQIDKYHNWFTDFFSKSFPLVDKTNIHLINDFYKNLLEYLDSNKILDKKIAKGVVNYGLDPDCIFLSNKVKAFTCSNCGHELNVGEENENQTLGMSCLKRKCSGKYQPSKQATFDYYRMVYNRGRSLRIYANDHTGLIDRNKREKLEVDFKKRPFYSSTNVLVATSTLEMGIDIGDLNITFNSSLPPETSNYLQRVGRAGRSSGTSLIMNLAGREQHDLYYFMDPMKMMAGEIKTPACYLNAKDILRRHFMAFCFDSWASLDPDANRIPFMVRNLQLKSLPINDGRFIFNQLANFIEKNSESLYYKFLEHYTDSNERIPLALNTIHEELISGTLLNRLTNIHTQLLEEIKHYEAKRKKLNADLKKLPESDPESDILRKEKRALSSAIYNINKRNVVEYLTNIGILPNYAFPETGVSLNAQIVKRKEENGATTYTSDDFGEIVRPASSAISELAPANKFYSQGHMLEIQGLEILSKEEFETYRFCSACDEMQLDASIPSTQVNCPKCGHNSWGATSNKKNLLRLKSVISVNDNEKSKITDKSDDRDRKFYKKSVHIKTQADSSKGARILKRIPFGIEFFAKTKYIDINTGINEEGFFGNNEIEINGNKFPEVGYVVCRSCGKATERKITDRELSAKKKSYHFAYCSNRKEEYQGHADQFFEEIYLYREFYTEAIKILLPVQDFRTDERVAVFKSGLYLGLKNYYKGHPDHVQIREYEEFNRNTSRKDRYLVMYETIPGGTGYLSKLFDTREFTKLLTTAYDTIRLCKCKDEGKDGCYNCIYTYGNQYERETLSRDEAEILFKNIIEKTGEWNTIESLQGADVFANREESDLEEQFIELLANKFDGQFYDSSDHGIKKYNLRLQKNENEILYEIWPQNLNATLKGVKYTTTPDFVFKCIALKINGESMSMERVQAVKDIVVYLDGYAYHASAQHQRVPSDYKIRNSILESEKYLLWVFTWDDIINKAKKNLTDVLADCENKTIMDTLKTKHPKLKQIRSLETNNQNSFHRFIHLLNLPFNNLEIENWASMILFSCQERPFAKCLNLDDLNKACVERNLNEKKLTQGKTGDFAFASRIKFSEEMKICTFTEMKSLSTKSFSTINEDINEWNKENWEFFWQVYNLMQFSQLKSEGTTETIVNDSERIKILENFDDSLHPIVNQILDNGIEINTLSDFNLMQDGEIIADAELGSNSKKFFMNAFTEEEREKFLQAGYQEFTLENFEINKLK
jgi:DEAD/DEAH box helicase domain-containing protein